MLLKEATIAALTAELKQKDSLLQIGNEVYIIAFGCVHICNISLMQGSQVLPEILTLSMPLKWNKPMWMPLGVWAAQVVRVGQMVYIGGGGAESSRLLEYNIEGSVWKLIVPPVDSFGLAAVNDTVIIAGGSYKGSGDTNRVWTLQPGTGTWLQPFPCMPTARSWPSAVGYKKWLFVAGGSTKQCVEVLDTSTKQWYTALPLPHAIARPSLALLQDMIYIGMEKTVIRALAPMLISDAICPSKAATPTKWESLPGTLDTQPALVEFHGHLLAVGAFDTPSSNMAIYLPLTRQWQSVAQLSIPREGCACLVLPDTRGGSIMVMGGCGKAEKSQYIKTLVSAVLY